MVEYIPPPEPRSLLAPLLACLPTAFASPRAPPALIPLISPILRQRVKLLTSASSSDSWLKLLCWDPVFAGEVEKIVAEAGFEPHPVSGEIEISDDIIVQYKRLDQETLRARLDLQEYNLTILYLWCPTDQEGGGPGWRVTEVLPFEALKDENNTWAYTVRDANELRQDSLLQQALEKAEQNKGVANGSKDTGLNTAEAKEEVEEDDDDDYWAQYDGDSGGTPAPHETPAQNPLEGGPVSDTDYYGRYGDVQPALDNDDPTMPRDDIGDVSLNGDALSSIFKQQMEKITRQQQATRGHEEESHALSDYNSTNPAVPLNHPRPASASSTGSDAVSKLEQTAESQCASEIGVKQHISTSIKSLYRLAKSAGIARQEFAAILNREIDVLELVDADEY